MTLRSKIFLGIGVAIPIVLVILLLVLSPSFTKIDDYEMVSVTDQTGDSFIWIPKKKSKK